MIELISTAVLFVFLSGFFAMVEAAVLSISHAEVEELVVKNKSGARALRSVTRKLTRSVVVLVIFTNIVNILGPIMVGKMAIELYGNFAIGAVTAILTLATIVFSEIIPKSIGAHRAPMIGRLSAPYILALTTLLYPVVLPLEKLTEFFKTGKRVIGSEQQIRSLASMGRKAGHIESDEGQLVHRAFLLNDRTAADVMTPLKDIISVSESSTIRDAADKVFKNSYSRYPIFGSSINEVKGLAMSQDVLEAMTEGKDNEPIMSLAGEALIVPSEKPSDELLTLFREKFIHLAIVQKEGHTVGLVTLEDVLEELVGEIEDESDVEVD